MFAASKLSSGLRTSGFKVKNDISFQRALNNNNKFTLSSNLKNSFAFRTPSIRFYSQTPSFRVTQTTMPSVNYILLAALGLGTALLLSEDSEAEETKKVDYEAVKTDIIRLLQDPKKEDTWGPVLVRLAWHASGSYSQFDKTGGSNGATMRFCPESRYGANNGLGIARDALEPIKKKHPNISYADLWVLASIVAIKELGGPEIKFTPGRVDFPDGKKAAPDGRLPDATRGADHIRAIFYRMGFSDREITALVGAHALGRCHEANSGFIGKWTPSPDFFSNDFYVQLLNVKWEKVTLPNGNFQYMDPNREIMMLPADMEFATDPDFRKWTEAYAKDEELFFKDFAAAYEKLVNFNLPTN